VNSGFAKERIENPDSKLLEIKPGMGERVNKYEKRKTGRTREDSGLSLL